MPKATTSPSSPSKKKQCPICHIHYRIKGFTSHLKKCRKEQLARQGEEWYVKKKLHEIERIESAGASMTVYTWL